MLPLRILHVMAGNRHGGAETAFVDFCIVMKKAGIVVEAATRSNDIRVPRLKAAGITVHELPFGGPLDIYTRWKLKKIVRSFRPAIVQTWMARAAQKMPNRRAVPDAPPYLIIPRVGGYYKARNFQESDYIIALTPDIKTRLADGGFPAERIAVINYFAAEDEDLPAADRASLDTPEDAPLLLSLGRLHENKAHDITLRALQTLPGVYLWIAGEGPLRNALETMAAELGVADRVRFLGWRTDRAALFKASDICVFASREEPFGVVFAQSWAAKVPVIVADVGGPGHFCRDHEDSLVIPKDDPAALSAAIAEILKNKDLHARLIANGHKRYLGEFTPAATVDAYMSYFAQCLEREGITPAP